MTDAHVATTIALGEANKKIDELSDQFAALKKQHASLEAEQQRTMMINARLIIERDRVAKEPRDRLVLSLFDRIVELTYKVDRAKELLRDTEKIAEVRAVELAKLRNIGS